MPCILFMKFVFYRKKKSFVLLGRLWEMVRGGFLLFEFVMSKKFPLEEYMLYSFVAFSCPVVYTDLQRNGHKKQHLSKLGYKLVGTQGWNWEKLRELNGHLLNILYLFPASVNLLIFCNLPGETW